MIHILDMASVTYFPGQPPLNMSIGGITFQSNGYTNIARLKPLSAFRGTPKMKPYMALFQYLTTQWNALSSVNKATWDDMMAAHDHDTIWGPTHAPSGFMWFMSCNINLSLCGFDIISACQPWSVPPAIPDYYIGTSSDHLHLNWVPAIASNPYGHLVYATRPMRKSVADLRSKNYFIQADNQSDFDTIDILSNYESSLNINWASLWVDIKFSVMFRVRQIDSYNGMSSVWTNNYYFPID